mmetsp:Transcript_36113/g.96638  ORF Transcript_36113/g.96638 Transcript_36113/m.96638 type:complete len:220 (-) Transcript_36113:452-1111(-)
MADRSTSQAVAHNPQINMQTRADGGHMESAHARARPRAHHNDRADASAGARVNGRVRGTHTRNTRTAQRVAWRRAPLFAATATMAALLHSATPVIPGADAAITVKTAPHETECFYEYVPGGLTASIHAFAESGCGFENMHIEMKLHDFSETYTPYGEAWTATIPASETDGNARVCVANYNEDCTYFVTAPAPDDIKGTAYKSGYRSPHVYRRHGHASGL